MALKTLELYFKFNNKKYCLHAEAILVVDCVDGTSRLNVAIVITFCKILLQIKDDRIIILSVIFSDAKFLF